MTMSPRLKILIAVNLAALIGLGGVVGVAYKESLAAAAQADQARARLVADLQAAGASGFTAADLHTISAAAGALTSDPSSLLPTDRTSFYRIETATAGRLDVELKAQQEQLVRAASDDLAARLASASAAITQDQQLDAPESDLATFRQRQDTISGEAKNAASIKDLRKLKSKAVALLNDLTAASSTQQEENSAIQQAANNLVQQMSSNLGAIQQAGNAALVNARNDAAVAAYEAKAGRFTDSGTITGTYNRMEHYAPRLSASDASQAAYGAAAIQRYADQVHQLFVKDLGPKHIVVSFQAQRLYAYENGQVVMTSLVTTGVRGVTAYGTDFGPMKVLFRSHPWKMHSPWPRGSVHWYPDTYVQWATFFTNSGESIHDAYWQPDYSLGPGSQFSAWTRSHGCIHLPYGLAQFVYNWAVEGTPVDVYPGNGQNVAEQLSEMTTDDQGTPLNPA